MKFAIFKGQMFMAMDIKAERSLIIKELQKIEDISLLRALKHMIYYGLKNEGRISVEQYNQEIEEAESRVAEGHFFSQDEVEKMGKKW
jgi:hypothetical protein